MTPGDEQANFRIWISSAIDLLSLRNMSIKITTQIPYAYDYPWSFPKDLGPLLLTWFNFNPSMDK